MLIKQLKTEEDTFIVAKQIANAIHEGAVIFLYGQLGAGKTTFCRGFLRALGYEDKVKSPTYTLVEPYEINHQLVFHFDLYRLNDPQELDNIGIQEYFSPGAICLVEWPEKGAGYIPNADLKCSFEFHENGRMLYIEALTQKGQQILAQL